MTHAFTVILLLYAGSWFHEVITTLKLKQVKLTGYFMLLLLSAFNNSYSQSAFPVTLSNPMDFDTILETEPNFIWQTNITALQTDPRYTQRYVLCELGENQLKGDAIAINTPILVLEDYQNTMHSYTSSSTPLEPGHTYVWQVSILFNRMIMDQSEPYQFTILKPKDPLPSFYPVVFKNSVQTYSVTDDRIGLVTDEVGDLKLTVQIYKNGRVIKNGALKDFKTEEQKKNERNDTKNPTAGKRFLVLELKELNLEKGQYHVVWTPKNKKTFQFNFKID